MKTSDFLKSWEGSLTENKWNRVANVGLSAALMLLVFMVFSKDQIVVLQPVTLGSEAWITKNKASESYKESWGFMLAQLSGNVTPQNVDFIKERFKPLLSPAIYDEVIDALEIQAQSIKDDRIKMRFEPRFVEYESTTDKVYVYGYSFIKGSGEDEDRQERTYEYIIRIGNYAPMIVDLDTYAGKPRTEKVLEQLQKQEQKRSKRDA